MSVLLIGGRPGTGKSTLVSRFLNNKETETLQLAPLVKAVHLVEEDIYVLGTYEEGESFPGTDRLSMAVQPKATEWLKSNPDKKVLLEGDRLFNLKFITSLEDSGIDFQVLVLEVSEQELVERYRRRGSNQSEKFLKGRKTKVEKIKSSKFQERIKVSSNTDEIQFKENLQFITEFFNGNH